MPVFVIWYTFLTIGNFLKSFCGFTSRKGVFAREEALKLRSPTFLSRARSFPDTLELRKLLTFAGILLGFNAILKISAVQVDTKFKNNIVQKIIC